VAGEGVGELDRPGDAGVEVADRALQPARLGAGGLHDSSGAAQGGGFHGDRGCGGHRTSLPHAGRPAGRATGDLWTALSVAARRHAIVDVVSVIQPPLTGLSPVPGDPDAVESLARRCAAVSQALREDGDRLRGASGVDGWDGEAARAFRAAVRNLPRDLRRAAESYESVARTLTGFAAALRAAQARGRLAQRRLDELGADFPVQWRELDLLDPRDPAAQARAQQRAAEIAAARAGLDRAVTEASEAGRRAAVRVQAACDAPYDRPGVFGRAADAVGEWVDRHAETLAAISDVLGAVSALASVAALAVPPAAPVAANVAAWSAAISLGIRVALAGRGHIGWWTVAVDGLTTRVPGGRAVTRRVGPGERGRPERQQSILDQRPCR